MKLTSIKALRAAALSLAMIISLSCTKELREQQYEKQEKLIETFITSQTKTSPDAKVTHLNGATRLTLVEGEGMEATARGTAGIWYALYDFSTGRVASNTLAATNSKDVAVSSKWELDDKTYELLEIKLSDKEILKGLRDGLEGVREGEECWILFCGKYAFGKSKVGTIPANAPLAFHVWVEKVEN